MKSRAIILVLPLALLYAVNCGADDTNCTLKSLEKALYNNENSLNLRKAFYPPGKYPSRLLRVTYTFEKMDEDDIDCSVTYYRSTGGFLFIQPPDIFRLTSLYFNFPEKSSYEAPKEVNLTLPYDCRGIVHNSSSTSSVYCSCHHHDQKEDGYFKLDTLTQQVRDVKLAHL